MGGDLVVSKFSFIWSSKSNLTAHATCSAQTCLDYRRSELSNSFNMEKVEGSSPGQTYPEGSWH